MAYKVPTTKSPLTTCMEDYLLLLLVEQPDFMFTNPDGKVTQIVRSTGKLPDTVLVRRSYEAALASLTNRGIVIKTVKQGRIHRLRLDTKVFGKTKSLAARAGEIRESALNTFLGTAEDHEFAQLVEDCQRGLVALQRAATKARRKNGRYAALQGGKVLEREGLSKERVAEIKHYLRKLRLAWAKSSAGEYVWWWQVEQGATVEVDMLKTRIIKEHIKTVNEAVGSRAVERNIARWSGEAYTDTPETLPDSLCGPVQVRRLRLPAGNA